MKTDRAARLTNVAAPSKQKHMTNIAPSDQWAENVLNAMKRAHPGRQRVEQAPPEIIQEVLTEYKGVLNDFLDLISGEEMTLEKVITHFEQQVDQWSRVSREDRTQMNYFQGDNPHGWTPEQHRAADDFEYHYRAVASRRLLSFFERLAGVEDHKNFVAVGNVVQIGEPSLIDPTDIKRPPLDYVGRWNLMQKYGPNEWVILNELWREAKELGEIGMEWPEPPDDYSTFLVDLETSEKPHELLTGIDRPDAMPLLDYLLSQVRQKEWNLVAGGEPNKRVLQWMSFEPVPEDYRPPTEEIQRIGHLLELVYHEQTRRQVGTEVWDRVAALIRKHWDKYPANERWDGVSEQAVIAGKCAHWKKVLGKYSDRPQVITDKVEELLSGWQENYERQRQRAHELAVKDMTVPDKDTSWSTPEKEAKLADRDARHAEFMYVVYRDFLSQWLPHEEREEKPLTATERFFKEFLGHNTGFQPSNDYYREVASTLPGEKGATLSWRTINSYYRKFIDGQKKVSHEAKERIINELQAEEKSIDEDFLRQAERHCYRAT